MPHSSQYPGLQQASVGENYPFSVSKKGDYWYAWNLLTGQQGPMSKSYKQAEKWIDEQQAYLQEQEQAWQEQEQAEQDRIFQQGQQAMLVKPQACYRKQAEQEIKAIPDTEHPTRFILKPQQEQPASLQEYTFLIPTCRNTSRLAHSQSTWSWLHGQLSYLFHGYTHGGIVHGSWIDEQGQEITEASRLYRVAIPASKQADLVGLLDKCKIYFEQDCIYLALTSKQADLV